MAFKVNYRAAQGQQGAQTPGGGYLLDQINYPFAPVASGASADRAFAVIPQVDTADFRVSILGDYTPTSAGTPTFRVGRVTLALGVSFASGASNQVVTVQRSRTSAASVSVSAATIATFDFTSINMPAAFSPIHRAGSLISNGVLQAGDILRQVVTSVGQGSLPAGLLQVDIEG